MGLKIYWTEFSRKQLDDIFEYYLQKASKKVASKIIEELVQESLRLAKISEIGANENLLSHLNPEYRYLVHKNYKILYLIIKSKGLIEIHDVFDTRQNPTKINRNK